MFSKRLTEIIDKKGLSRYQISKDTKITEATLSNYCKGKVNPSPLFVKLLAEYLNVDYDWLLTGKEPDLDKSSANSVAESMPKYRARKKNFSKTDINSIIKYFEEQLKTRDDLLKYKEEENLKQLASIEDKLNALVKEIRKLNK